MGYCSKEISGPYPGEDARGAIFFFPLQYAAMPKPQAEAWLPPRFYDTAKLKRAGKSLSDRRIGRLTYW
jgi:hypothetical protein